MGLPDGYVGINNVVTRYGRHVSLPSVVYKKWTNPAVLDVDAYLIAVVMAAAAGTTTWWALDGTLTGVSCVAGICKPDVPRNVVITVTHGSSIIACAGVVAGTDVNDQAITEAWTVAATGTSTTWTGAKAFKTITSITAVVGADAHTNTIVIGTGKVLGLDIRVSTTMKLLDYYDAAVSSTASALVAASIVATADAIGTYTPYNTVQTGHTYEVAYLSVDPQDS